MTTGRERAAVLALLSVSVGATAVVLEGGFNVPSVERATCLGVALGALGAVVLVKQLRRALSMRVVLVASLVLMSIAVVEPPQESHDMWSYAMNGRILAHYGENPYTHAPADYPHDPLLPLVGSDWRHTRSLYGPAFTVVSAAVMSVTGTAVLPTRLAFQILSALAVVAALVLLARKTRDPVVVLLVGLNPVIALEVVNVGRNDSLVGIALLGGVLLATRRRMVAAAAVLALAGLVKITMIAALAGLLLWAWRRHGARVAAAAGGAAAAVLGIPYLLAGGIRALRPVANASNRMSRASIWQLARAGAVEHLVGAQYAQRVRDVIGTVGPAALVVVVAFALLFAVSRLGDPTPELVAVGAVAAFFLAGSYVLASYAAWVIPIAAWRHRAGVSRAVLGWSAMLTIAYQAVRPLPTDPEDLAVWLVSTATLLLAAVALVALTVAAVRRLRPPAADVPIPLTRELVGET